MSAKAKRQDVLAMINTIFVPESAEAATAQWRTGADQLRAKFPKLATMMDNTKQEVLTFMGFPGAPYANPQRRPPRAAERRGQAPHQRHRHIPDDKAIIRHVGAMMMEQNDAWSLQRCYVQLEGLLSLSVNQPARLSAVIN